MLLTQSATRPVRLPMPNSVTSRSPIMICSIPRSLAARPAPEGFRRLGLRFSPTVAASSGSGSESGPVNSGTQLPKGVWWLDPASTQHDVVYGSNGSFVLQRPRRGGPGLVQMPGAH